MDNPPIAFFRRSSTAARVDCTRRRGAGSTPGDAAAVAAAAAASAAAACCPLALRAPDRVRSAATCAPPPRGTSGCGWPPQCWKMCAKRTLGARRARSARHSTLFGGRPARRRWCAL
eukprot:366406-Chlamydomonas_euryale.AAC.43